MIIIIVPTCRGYSVMYLETCKQSCRHFTRCYQSSQHPFRGSYAHFTKRLRRLPKVIQSDKNQDTSQTCLARASRHDVSAWAGDLGPAFPFLSASLFLGDSKLCRSTLRNMHLSHSFLKERITLTEPRALEFWRLTPWIPRRSASLSGIGQRAAVMWLGQGLFFFKYSWFTMLC